MADVTAIRPLATPVPAARPRRLRVPALRGYFWLMIALLYLPIAILFVFSVNANTTLAFPLRGFTLDWYAKLFATQSAGASSSRCRAASPRRPSGRWSPCS